MRTCRHVTKEEGRGGQDPSCVSHFVQYHKYHVHVRLHSPIKSTLRHKAFTWLGSSLRPTGQQGWTILESRSQLMQGNAGRSKE